MGERKGWAMANTKSPKGKKLSDREKIRRQLRKMAFGKANDCVRLVLDGDAKLDGLDLSLLTELKRNDKGTLEVRLVDRLRALEQLAALAQSSGTDLESFLQAMQGGGEST